MINVEPTQYISIKEGAIERRYYESLESSKTLMTVCDEITTYDNTKQIGEIAYMVKGNLKLTSENMPVYIDPIGFYYKIILEWKKLIRNFVKEVVVFKDHIEVTFNMVFSLLTYLNFKLKQ